MKLKSIVVISLVISSFHLEAGPEAAVAQTQPNPAPLPKAPEIIKPEPAKVVVGKEKAMEPAEALKYEREQLFGEPVRDAKGTLLHVEENKSQTHAREQCAVLHVKNFKIRNNEPGRIRVAVWNSPENYGKEGLKPFRSSSYWAKEAPGGEMIFKICGLEIGKEYSFFGHFDKNNDGVVNRILGIPTEPYIFSNKANQGKGAGLSREGLSPPKFENTLVTYTGPGQEIVLSF